MDKYDEFLYDYEPIDTNSEGIYNPSVIGKDTVFSLYTQYKKDIKVIGNNNSYLMFYASFRNYNLPILKEVMPNDFDYEVPNDVYIYNAEKIKIYVDKDLSYYKESVKTHTTFTHNEIERFIRDCLNSKDFSFEVLYNSKVLEANIDISSSYSPDEENLAIEVSEYKHNIYLFFYTSLSGLKKMILNEKVQIDETFQKIGPLTGHVELIK